MLHNVFTIFDEKARAYLPPFFLPEDGMAIRTFSDCVNAKDHQFAAHPHDYTLFKIGTWDNNIAFLETFNAPQSLGNGVEFVTTPESAYEIDDAAPRQNDPAVDNDPSVLPNSQSGNST